VLYARAMGLDLMFYDQRPVHGDETVYWKRKILAVWHFVLFWKPFVRISPVLGDESAPLARSRSYYVPFVAPTWRSPENRSYFDGGSINVIMIGKLYSERKNHLLLLKTINQLCEEYDLTLTIVGALDSEKNSHYQRILDYIDAHDIDDIVTIKQNIPYECVQEEYRCHDVYVLPSRNEPAAVSHLEAMTQGLAVICSNSNGTRQYVHEGANGYLFSCDSESDLLNTLEQVISSRKTIHSFGQESLRLARTEYSPENFYIRLCDIINKNF
jgi:glycosyltransferase involved in cell wall biosynthesis